MEDGLISSAVEAKLIVQDGKYACKSTFIIGADDAAGGEKAIKVEVEVEVEVEPADGGGNGKVIKVKVNSSSNKQQLVLPVPSAEHGQPQADEVAANVKVKLD